MPVQVITVHSDGKISGLQVKKGRGLDLRSFGPAKIVRASEIVWDEDNQAWAVEIMDAPGFEDLKGCRLTHRSAAMIGLELTKALPPLPGDYPVALFEHYEDAVEFEIAYLDAHRLAGRF